MLTTANWHGTRPETKSLTRPAPGGGVWACRKVRSDGSVLFLRRRFTAPVDALIQPVPGEWLLFYNYGPGYDESHGPTCNEWTAPTDPDGVIRRTHWEEKTPC